MAIRHKRDAAARRKPRAALVAGPLALLATGTAVTLGVLGSDPAPSAVLAQEATTTGISRADDIVSRSESRQAAARGERYIMRLQDGYDARQTRHAVTHAHVHRWSTALLNLWASPEKGAEQVGLLDAGSRVLITGRAESGRVELAVDGKSRWVTAGYLSASKPEPQPKPEPATSPSSGSPSTSSRTAPAGLSTAPCPDGSVENGLTSGAVLVYRAVCHAFPQITSYGGWDAHGEHASGKAIDIMTSDKALGDQIAAFLQSHASELGLYDVIWWDRIWTPERAAEGWRDYGDHGSATANHMDHVHVSVN
ncbi:mucin-2 protein [Nocardioides panaciterrulae]|uniref:ARB-07466-like C-terminal domain-containing protein n=1 Tax=Nocardioides panaciterrulae TaxID=661492 RepID=A0A7Y9E526_9ACTN|nr:mucin-2 protein [Nocardioides panaciterrulae]NYD41403.1 hypothetical protein [Nocardioides panaciterrulae]